MRFLALVYLISLTMSATGAAAQPIPFKTLGIGNTSGIHTATQVAIRTSSAWRVLWQKHTAGQPKSAIPAIDFSRDMVAAVFLGEVPEFTRVLILKISRETDRLVVLVRIAQSQPGPVPTEPAASTPYHIVRLARSPLPVVFVQAPQKDVYKPEP